ncbi:MAG TPA: molybdenum cofactor biosynthesis protein MoaE [Gemmatimonadaceae bacterium]|nr:molybdenum cofactor biosynthesis protein MoaE [Gemmatimonadaceae bacterium]
MIRTAIVTRPIDASALIAEVASDTHGATSLFLGTVRDVNDGRAVTGMEYTAYDAMASRELAKIAGEAAEKFDDVMLVVEHRTGALALGDVSVAIAAAHAHRGHALDATRFVIEQLKKRVPIWKREHYVDGTREWIDPTTSHSANPTALDMQQAVR